MSKLFTTLWYNEEPAVASACLYNLRDNDLRLSGNILRGQILQGHCGFSVAEKSVSGYSGIVVKYSPNRCVDWFGSFLTCVALADLPGAPFLRGTSFRHKHYVVAEFKAAKDIAAAKTQGLPLVTSIDGRLLANLEIYNVSGRTPLFRRAELL